MTENKLWHMEYYNSYPNVRVEFTIIAPTFEDAIEKGNEAIKSLKRTATYEIHRSDLQ